MQQLKKIKVKKYDYTETFIAFMLVVSRKTSDKSLEFVRSHVFSLIK